MITRLKSGPAFRPGQLVRHQRYDYRGVVVAYDLQCDAPDEWYQTNQTQPDRDQPWYHVLVHGANMTTYAAQSSLLADGAGKRIDHPLVDKYFSEFTGTSYVRNNRPFAD